MLETALLPPPTKAELKQLKRDEAGCGHGPQMESANAAQLLYAKKPRDAFVVLGYTMANGSELLRREVCKMYKTLGEEDVNIVVPEEGIYLSMLALLKPGDHVVVTFPGYQSLYEVARSLGCTMHYWKVRKFPRVQLHPHKLRPHLLPQDPTDLPSILHRQRQRRERIEGRERERGTGRALVK